MAKAPSRKSVGKKAGGKSAGAKRAGKTGAAKSAKKSPKRTTTKRTRPAGKPIKGGIPVTCSECYADFMMSSKASQDDALVCPVCMHQGEIPEPDVMGQIRVAVGRAKSAAFLAAIPAILLVVVGFAQAIVNARSEEVSDGLNYGMLGAIVVLLLVSIVLAMKHEKSRVEVYF